MATIEINDTSLYYEDTGPGSSGETVAFSHGLLWNTTLFDAQIAALRGRYRCIAWDHRGQGRSAQETRHCIDMELVWKDAVALLEKLAVGPVHFCGLSMGGFVGLRMAARRPDLLRSLMLLETSADPEPPENAPRYRALSAVTRYLGTGLVMGKVAPIMLGKSFLADPARAAERERAKATMSARKDIWRAVNGVIDRAGVYDELGRIGAPTLIVVGDEDVATVPAKAERMHAAIRGSKLIRIAGAGHSSTVERPSAVNAALEEFLGAARSR
jgi:pimeloyl-ACP methyl ester carboxylesterase